MHVVSIQRVDRYQRELVKEGVIRLLEPLGGMGRFVKRGERVLVKPNMLSAKPPEAAVTTHPELLRAVIELAQECGARVAVGDSPGIGSTRRVAERSGMLQVIEETGAELAPFTEAVPVAGEGTFRRFELARPYVEADRLINLPKLKTHEMMTLTCCVKNLFGAVVGPEKAAWHLKAGADRALFARMLLEIYLLRTPDLNIVDAITAMEGDGPGSGDPRQVGLLLAGENALALDHVCARIAGMPEKLLYVEKEARALSLPGSVGTDIDIRGLPLAEAAGAPFRLPRISDVQWGMPPFLKNRLRHQLTSRPEVLTEKCQLCGVCVRACPPQAMQISGGELTIDYPRCIRCFCCRELCPHHALRLRDGTILGLIKKVRAPH